MKKRKLTEAEQRQLDGLRTERVRTQTGKLRNRSERSSSAGTIRRA